MSILTAPPLPAPELKVSQWFNTQEPLSLAGLRGKVVMLHAFQMLCRACVKYATPQAQEVHQRFASLGVVVLGLHTVFEHHAAMQPVSLQAWLEENQYRFPVAVDQAGEGVSGIPATMRAYAMEGTPTLALIDRRGQIRLRHFGHLPDLALGAMLGQLLDESDAPGD